MNAAHSGRIHVSHDEENPRMLCVTDPHLGSVDYVIVLVFFSARPQRKCITARLCFREAEAPTLSQQVGRGYGKFLVQQIEAIYTRVMLTSIFRSSKKLPKKLLCKI